MPRHSLHLSQEHNQRKVRVTLNVGETSLTQSDPLLGKKPNDLASVMSRLPCIPAPFVAMTSENSRGYRTGVIYIHTGSSAMTRLSASLTTLQPQTK